MLLYNQLVHNFTHKAIVDLDAADSGEKLTERLSGLLTDLGFQGLQPHGITQLKSQLRTFVQDKAVLLLVDNVCNAQQLDALLPEALCFGPGSRVVITSRLASMPSSTRYKVGDASSCAQHCMHQSPCCSRLVCHKANQFGAFHTCKAPCCLEGRAAPCSERYMHVAFVAIATEVLA
jgi:hypothetical protein